MSFFPEIRFVGLPPSESLDASARRHATRLSRFCPSVTACRTTIEFRRSRRHGGPEFAVHVDVDLPGREIGVDQSGEDDGLAVLRRAFEEVEQRVEAAMRSDRPRRDRSTSDRPADEAALAEGDPLDATDSPDEGMTGN